MIRVLAIDDDAAVLGAIAKLFRTFGKRDWVVTPAGALDAPEAVAAEPDVVLLDLTLGDIAGVATLERAKEAWPECPIVVLTGAYLNGLTAKLLDAGAAAVLSKTDVLKVDGFPELLTALRDAFRDAGHTRKAATIRTNLSNYQAASTAKKVAAYVLGGFGLLGGGGGAALYQGCPGLHAPAPAVAPVAYETKEHADEVATRLGADVADVKAAVGEVRKAVGEMTPVLYEMRGILRTQERRGRDER